MRILLSMLKVFFALLVLAAVVLLISREALLISATHVITSSLGELQRAGTKGTHIGQCQNRGFGFIDGSEAVMQLRFLSDTEFVLEVKCSENSTEAILISRKNLPPFVTKVQGGSGFPLFGRSAIKIEVFRSFETMLKSVLFFEPTFLLRSKTIAAEDGFIIEDFSPFDFENGPITSCSGYGYFCCDAVAEKGAGEQIIGLNGCEERCYASCVARPLVLSFTTNPFFDFKTRKLSLRNGETVEFSYVVDTPAGTTATATFDFGDGETSTAEGENGTVSHTYSCPNTTCEYPASIQVIDNWGIESIISDVSKLMVVVE